MRIKKVGIILKKGSAEAQRLGAELADWFSRKSITAVVDTISSDMDVLVILGGDGTLLHVADQASLHRIPVVGVNLGDLGFLTEVAVSERFQALEAIMAGSVVIEERMMLKACVRSGDQPDGQWRHALNDVVISKGNVDRLVHLTAWANDEYITTYKADGLIFSTPTGSTAYNLSAAGPIVHPALHSILVTPICPFMLESRSVLLPGSAMLRIALARSVNDVKVIVDGQFAWDMKESDQLVVEASEKPLQLICSPQKGYFEILSGKLNWGGRPACPSPGNCCREKKHGA